jgi:O-Antigen ligase
MRFVIGSSLIPQKYSLLSSLTGAYLFFFYMQASLRWEAFEAIRFHFTFGLLLTCLCLVRFFKNDRSNFTARRLGLRGGDPSKRLISISLVFILIAGAYTIFTFAPEESSRVFSDRIVKFALISFFIFVSVNRLDDLKVVVLGILLAWLKISSEGFIGWFTGGLMWENQGIQRLHGASPFVGHPNSFSAFALGCFAFAFAMRPMASSAIDKALLSALAFFSIIIVIFTGSRSGYVAIVLVSIFLFFRLKTNKLKIFFLALLGFLALLPLVPEQYYGRFESIFTGEEAEGNSSGTRMVIMQDAIEMYLTYPMGIGVQAFSEVRLEMFGRVQNIHMLYLEVLTNLGPFGFIVFSLFVVRLLSLASWNIKNAALLESNYIKSLSTFVFMFLMFRLVFGLFAMDLYEPHWWLASGLLLACFKLLLLDPDFERESRKRSIGSAA